MQRRSVLASSATALAVGLAGCLGEDGPPFEGWRPKAGAWPLGSYDPANTAYNPHATPPSDGVETRWRERRGGRIYGAVGSDDLLVAYGESGLWAFDTATGDELWSHDHDTRAAGIFDGAVYACGRDDSEGEVTTWLASYDLGSGEEAYRVDEVGVGQFVNQLLVVDSHITVTGSSEDGMFVFDRRSGDRRTRLEVGRSAGFMDDRLIANGNGILRAFEYESGWLTGEASTMMSTNTVTYTGALRPGCRDGRIITGEALIGAARGRRRSSLHAYDADRGIKQWTSVPRGFRTFPPAIAEGVGFAAQELDDPPHTIATCFELADGRERWDRDVPGAPRTVIATPELVLVGGIHGQLGYVRAFDRAGNERWMFEFYESPAWESGVIAIEETVYVTTYVGDIIALEPV